MVGKRLRHADEKIMKMENDLQEWCDKLEVATRLRRKEPMREMIIEVFVALRKMEKAAHKTAKAEALSAVHEECLMEGIRRVVEDKM